MFVMYDVIPTLPFRGQRLKLIMSPEQIADYKDDYNTDQDGGQVYLSRARFTAASVGVSESKKYKKI